MENNTIKIKKFFSSLSFVEETHKYSIDNIEVKKSVSGLIKLFCPTTDFKEIAKNTDKRDNLPPGTTSIIWELNSKVSLALGTAAHFFGELYAFHRNLLPRSKYEEAIVKFWKELPPHIVPVIMELKMYHKKYKFAGTGDILLYNTITGHYIIGDYKTNKDLFKNFKETKMLGIFSKCLDNAFNHYQIQLSFYQILLEQTGFIVEGRKIIHIKPDGNYDMYDTEDHTEILKGYLKNNKVC